MIRRGMRTPLRVAMMSVVLGLGGCALGASNTEGLLSQAGFRKIPLETPQRADGLPNRQVVKRTTEGKPEYVYADPKYCKCLYVGSESEYASYQTLIQQQEAARAYEEGLKRKTPGGI